ncbi:putative multiple inositol polyphosphate phosphatase, partial [Operophtera brumata]
NRFCISDLNLIQLWQWNNRQNLTFAGDLTSDGYISTQQLAQAWKQKFPGLFPGKKDNYLPYKTCPVWLRDIEQNNETLSQKRIFESKMEYREMLNNISQRLGFKYETQAETILSVYQMCRYVVLLVSISTEACNAIKSKVLTGFNFLSEIPQQPLAMITFTDTPMLLATLSALGARQDSAPLTGDNYRTPL